MIRRFSNYLPISLWFLSCVTLLWLSLSLLKREVFADTHYVSPQDNKRSGSWEFSLAPGYGQRSQALVGQDDREIYLSADIAYYHGRFFFDNGDLGWNLVDSPNVNVNLLGHFRNERELWASFHSFGVQLGGGDRIDSSGGLSGEPPVDGDVGDEVPPISSESTTTSAKLPGRDTSFLAGLETIFSFSARQAAYLVATTDVSSTHDGQAVSAGYRLYRIWRRFYIQPSIDATWKSAVLNDYYFGVRESEADEVFDAYNAGADISYSGAILVNYALTKDVFLGFSIKYTQLGNQTVDSPLIDEDAISTYFMGLKYQF